MKSYVAVLFLSGCAAGPYIPSNPGLPPFPGTRWEYEFNPGFGDGHYARDGFHYEKCIAAVLIDDVKLVSLGVDDTATLEVPAGGHVVRIERDKGMCGNFSATRWLSLRERTRVVIALKHA